MKGTIKVAVALFVLLASTSGLFAQGTVNFSNTSGTRITNCLTGTLVSTGAVYVALYYAPDGVTDESAFTQVGAPTPVTYAGLFSGGSRTIPTPVPGGWAMLQLRAFEISYGSTYEQALAAPPQNGRYALTGKSIILRVDTADPTTVPPQTPPRPNFPSFTVCPAALPLPQLRIRDALVFEGDDGSTNLEFEVHLIGGSNEVVTVDFTTADNSASSGSDYTLTTGTLSFGPGETVKTIVVPVSGDTDIENDEVVLVNLSNPIHAFVADPQGAGTIYNDDCRTSVALAFYPGVTINGCAGKPYEIQVAFEASPNQWTTVTNFVLPTSPYLWFDTVSPTTGTRYYRTILLPP